MGDLPPVLVAQQFWLSLSLMPMMRFQPSCRVRVRPLASYLWVLTTWVCSNQFRKSMQRFIANKLFLSLNDLWFECQLLIPWYRWVHCYCPWEPFPWRVGCHSDSNRCWHAWVQQLGSNIQYHQQWVWLCHQQHWGYNNYHTSWLFNGTELHTYCASSRQWSFAQVKVHGM